MSKLALILVAFAFAASNVSALADDLARGRSMAEICPRKEAAAADDLVWRNPPAPSPMSAEVSAKAAERQQQCIEGHGDWPVCRS